MNPSSYLSITAVVIMAAAQSECTPQGDVDMKTVPVVERTSRVQIQFVGKVADGLAYGGFRGLYIIKDNETGREFIGVSGIGIAETGSHSDGEDTVKHEQ